MPQAQRKFLPGMQYYVPAMEAASELGRGLRGRVQLGAPIVSSAALILSLASINAALDVTTFASGFANTEAQMSRFGRNLLVIASGAATSNVTIYGRDYLGQRMAESFTLNGANSVLGNKAFRYVDRVVGAVTASTTINVGVGTKLGLPYTILAVQEEYVDDDRGTVGTVADPVFTDPQTLTTGDPRGTYIPNSVPNGTKQYALECQFTMRVNTAKNGGLHGIRHVIA